MDSTQQGPTTYLVERYLPATAGAGLDAAVARLDTACMASGVRYLHSTYLPSEDTCFCVFQADSADAVRAVNETAEFGLDRITVAVLLPHGRPDQFTPRQPSGGTS